MDNEQWIITSLTIDNEQWIMDLVNRITPIHSELLRVNDYSQR